MSKQNNSKTETRPKDFGNKHQQNSVDKETITKTPSGEKMPRKK